MLPTTAHAGQDAAPETKTGINWRKHDYGGDETIADLRRKLERNAARRSKLRAQAQAADREWVNIEAAIRRRAVQLLVGQAVRMVPGATKDHTLQGDGVLLKVNRTRCLVRFDGRNWFVPLDWVRPADDGDWFTYCMFQFGGR